eukprot:12945397-Alexandrium_andersonii.AAC.1
MGAALGAATNLCAFVRHDKCAELVLPLRHRTHSAIAPPLPLCHSGGRSGIRLRLHRARGLPPRPTAG